MTPATKKQYQHSEQMKINLERTKELYPHKLITPGGIGNNKEFSPNYNKGQK